MRIGSTKTFVTNISELRILSVITGEGGVLLTK
jgi:hypothetical protein